MSDATLRTPSGQSASQLSENIGDVLASIRRLIAQDEEAEDAHAAAPAASATSDAASESVGGGVGGPGRSSFAQTVSRRRDILAEAQALTRRSEAAFGTAAALASAPLTLGAADRVPQLCTAPRDSGDAAARDAEQEGTAMPLVLAAPLGATPEPRSVPNVPAPLVVADNGPAATGAGTVLRTITPAATRTVRENGKEEDMDLTDPEIAGIAAPRQTGTVGAPTISVTRSPDVAPLAAAIASAGPQGAVAVPAGGPSAACDAAPPAAALAAHAVPPPAEPAPAPALGAPSSAPGLAVEDDSTASILRDMIREVVRQELTGDPAGRMTGELRTMIMREVAQVLTQGVRGGR